MPHRLADVRECLLGWVARRASPEAVRWLEERCLKLGEGAPERALFLDFSGAWDPSLAFVMVGAIGVHAIAFRLARRLERPLFAPRFDLSTRTGIDARLLAGAAIFGAGWGLSGICPGPAIVGLGLGQPAALVFVAAMSVGVWAQGAWDRRVSAWRVSLG